MISNSKRKEKEGKMPTKRQSKHFIDFITDAAKDRKLTDEFMSKKTPEHLHSFFQERGYRDVPYSHCQDILRARKRMGRRRIPGEGETADQACIGPNNY
jgi:tRNA 2-selenouridine synthase SelU